MSMTKNIPLVIVLVLLVLLPCRGVSQRKYMAEMNRTHTFRWEPGFNGGRDEEYCYAGNYSFEFEGKMTGFHSFSLIPLETLIKFNHSRYIIIDELEDSTVSDIPLHSIADSLSDDYSLCEPFPVNLRIQCKENKGAEVVTRMLRKCLRRHWPVYSARKNAIKFIFFNFEQEEAEKLLSSLIVTKHFRMVIMYR